MSNHLGNANKMDDTPRTDEAQFGTGRVSVDFARQLERELNAANSRIELLMSANADVARIAGERDAAEKRIRLLIAKLDKYQDHIKRLEEAGDEIIWAFCPASVSMMTDRESDALKLWNKAKEDKA